MEKDKKKAKKYRKKATSLQKAVIVHGTKAYFSLNIMYHVFAI